MEYAWVWRKAEPKVVEQAVALWTSLGALPPGVDPFERARELCAVAYMDGEMVGVATVDVRHSPLVGAKIGFMRALVAPQARRHRVAWDLVVQAYKDLEAWAAENPDEKMMGMGVVIQSRALAEFSRQPVWPQTGLTVIGYTKTGQQIRVAWFKHALLDLPQMTGPETPNAGF